MSRNRLYAILLLACVAGWTWLVYNINTIESEEVFGVCLFKGATNLPCPSCGSTRAIACLMHGDFIGSLNINPLGIIISLIMIMIPVWISYDLIRRRNSLYNFFKRLELFLQKPQTFIPAALLIFVNWIWNITKGL